MAISMIVLSFDFCDTSPCWTSELIWSSNLNQSLLCSLGARLSYSSVPCYLDIKIDSCCSHDPEPTFSQIYIGNYLVWIWAYLWISWLISGSMTCLGLVWPWIDSIYEINRRKIFILNQTCLWWLCGFHKEVDLI